MVPSTGTGRNRLLSLTTFLTHVNGPMNTERVKADKKNWSTVLGVVIVITVVGAYLIRSLLPLVTGHFMKQYDPRKIFTLVEMVLTLLFLSFIPIVFYLFSLGRGAIDSKSYLSPGVMDARNAQLLNGQRTVLRGQMMVFIAVLLILLALIGWRFTHFFVQSLLGQ